MVHSSSTSQDANLFRPLLDKEPVSRRTLLRNMAGLALTGGSLIPWATACSQAPGTAPASQPTASPALGTTIFTYHGHSVPVNAVAWSPDGKRIASGSADTTVQLWDATTGGQVFTYRGHAAEVYTVAWSPDGRRIASGDNANTVMVWQAP